MTSWQRDFRRLRKLGQELIEQADHFARNTDRGADDTIRSLLVKSRTEEIAKIGKRLARRWHRAHPSRP